MNFLLKALLNEAAYAIQFILSLSFVVAAGALYCLHWQDLWNKRGVLSLEGPLCTLSFRGDATFIVVHLVFVTTT